MGSFEWAGSRSLPDTKCERGFRAMGISIASDTRIDHLSEGGSGFSYEAKHEK